MAVELIRFLIYPVVRVTDGNLTKTLQMVSWAKIHARDDEELDLRINFDLT
jgi:hypothetical protein